MVDRLLIFTPTYDDLLRPETVASVEVQDFDGEVDWIVSDDNPFPGAANENVCHQFQAGRHIALDGGYDAMLCVEHDMVLPPGCIQALWNTDAPVVYAIYMLRHGTEVVSLFRKEGKSIGMSLSLFPRELKHARQRGVVEVSGAGFGCTLIRRSALEAVPFRMWEHPPDIPFASHCLQRGITQMGRLDVACGHIDIETERVLYPFEEDGGVIARVLALDSININVKGETQAIKRDRYYSLPVSVAEELQRAGYVRITNGADKIDTTPAEREIATAPEAEARETAMVKKIRPKRRTRAKKSGDQNE